MKLKIEQNFTDKYDKTIKYKAGDEHDFTEERAEELLKDPRKLVSKIEESFEEDVQEVEEIKEESTEQAEKSTDEETVEKLETAEKKPTNVETPEKKSKKRK